MPYTFAHIGYILPIKKKWKQYFSITGLVFGSLAPDYDILFRLTKVRFHIFQYDLKTICFFIFPIATISALFFHLFCRKIIIKNLPSPFFEKYQKYLSFDFIDYLKKHFLVFSASILLAIFLHLFLDFLCHILDAYSIQILVSEKVSNIFIIKLSGILAIYFLPVLFTLVGFFLLYILILKKRLNLSDFKLCTEINKFWTLIAIFTLALCVLKLTYTEFQDSYYIDYIIISITSSFIISVYLVCLVYYLLLALQKKELQ